MGSAAAWQLVCRGYSTIGFDQFAPFHNNGSSHGKTRVIRKAYFENPKYVTLLNRAYELWYELQSSTNEPILDLCGGLYVGPTDCDLIRGTLEAAAIHGLDCQDLSQSELQERYPFLNVRSDEIGLIEKDAGMVFAENSVAAMNYLASVLGATLVREKVIHLDLLAKPKLIVTSHRTVKAERVILTQGPWMASIFEELGLKVKITRQTVGWFTGKDLKYFQRGEFPVYAIERNGLFIYGIPSGDSEDLLGVKVACHNLGPMIGPDSPHLPVSVREEIELKNLAALAFPAANLSLNYSLACKYSNSPDGHFLIDLHPWDPDVVLAGGFSGHGFKFAPVIGEVLVNLAFDGKSQHTVDFLSLKRFA